MRARRRSRCEPQPRIAELESIVEGVAAAGVPVELRVDGDPQALSAGVQLAVFRVAQEALTNTLKHAERPTSARVRLRCDRDSVELDVLDTGSRAAAATPGGRGIRGMRERALAYGGELHAGPRPDGGWRVHMRVRPSREPPRREPARAEPPRREAR